MHAKLHGEITKAVYDALRNLMVHIDSDDVHHEILALKPLLDARHANDSLMVKYERFHAIARELDAGKEYHSFLNNQVNRYRAGMHQLRIREELFSARVTLMQWLFLIAGAPLAFIAIIVFAPIHVATERFVHTVIKDTLFRNSIRISFWTFVSPLYLALFFLVMKWAGAESPSIYLPLVAVPFGLVALPWLRNLKHITHALRCARMKQTTAFKEWLSHRSEVEQWLNKIPYIKHDV